MGLRLAVAGATGLVGQRLLEIIARKGQHVEEIGAFASADSAGRTIMCGERALTVQDLATADFAQYDAALFAVGDELSAEYVPQALAAGCAVVDKSNAFRLDPDVPLVVAGVNDDAISAETRLVANPNCSTIILSHALAPLERTFGLTRVFAVTYQSVSGAGGAAVDRFGRQVADAPATMEIARGADVDPEGFAFNVIPAVGGMRDGRCSEEWKLIEESRKVLRRPDLTVVAHAARVPVVVGHSIAVTVEIQRLAPREALVTALESSHDLLYFEEGHLPSPLSTQHHEAVEVGRLRGEPGLDNGWSFFVSGDNVNLGAALNGWRILEAMVKAGSVRARAGATI
jgi:aspartate-semialdehyde dehydrogenase